MNALGPGKGLKGRLGGASAGLNTCIWPPTSWIVFGEREGVGADWTIKWGGNEAVGGGLPHGYWEKGHQS